MNRNPIYTLCAALAAGGLVTLSGCAELTETQKGTATGAGIGAATGAVIGAVSGGNRGARAATGAVIGGAIGAGAGYVWSTRMQQQKQAMEQATKGTGVAVTQTPDNQLKLEIPSDISFDTGKSDIKPNLAPILDRFATSLKDHATPTVSIVGHTDSTGSDTINNPLSVNRAASTRDYLAARGVGMNRININGASARRGQHQRSRPRQEPPRGNFRRGSRTRCRNRAATGLRPRTGHGKTVLNAWMRQRAGKAG
jgi:outer membrane protein OmpA-like peptidoglycan-associated protein